MRIISSGQGAYFTVDGEKKLNFCSSHYLGLAVDDRLKKAAIAAIQTYGIGTGYRTLAGTNILNVALEKALADFKGTDDAIVLPSGYLANMAAIQTFIGKEDIVISDALNHASIIDAIRLSQVKNKFIYKHVDMADLETQIKAAVALAQSVVELAQTMLAQKQQSETEATDKASAKAPIILIVTDGVFSMDGDLAPLPEIVALAHKYSTDQVKVMTMVDDAHGEGVLGHGGRGIVDHFNLHGQVDIEVGTLSKAFSVIGGFITAKQDLIDLYRKNARQFMFTSTLTFPDTAALIEVVRILQESDELVQKLWENTRYLKDELTKRGFDIGNSKTPITPIMLGDEELAKAFAQELFDNGVFASAIIFPMVQKGSARIRLIPSASHSQKDIDFALEQIEKVGKKLKVI